MLNLSVSELDMIIMEMKSLVGARLQKITMRDPEIILEFWKKGDLVYLHLDLTVAKPVILLSEKPLSKFKNQPKPVAHFLKSHGENRILTSIQLLKELGKVIELHLGEEEPCKIEIRLFPHGVNVIVRYESKTVSLRPVHKLKPVQLQQDRESRTLFEILDQWKESKRKKGQSSKGQLDLESLRKKEIQRIERAINKVASDIDQKKDKPYRSIAEWIQGNQSLPSKSIWQSYLDLDKDWIQNMNDLFQKAKSHANKLEATKDRLQQLQEELIQAQSKPIEEWKTNQKLNEARESDRKSGLTQVASKAWRISPSIQILYGKSASENWKLLRAAKAWHYWLHLKDRPSSHGFIQRNKNEKISSAQLQQLAQWFLKMNFGPKSQLYSGEKFSLLLLECRHVRPIKGDKVGRVHYQESQAEVIHLTFDPS